MSFHKALPSLIASALLFALPSAASAFDIEKSVKDFYKGVTAGTELEKADKVDVKTDKYGTLLYEGYMALSAVEFNEGDYLDSDVFAERAMWAASDKRFEPEAIAARDLPADKLNGLQGQRRHLVVAQFRGAPEIAPADAAEAQVSFDCWMQEQEENRQPQDINACKRRFTNAMSRLDFALKPEQVMKRDRLVLEVFFDFDSAKLGEEALANIDDFARHTKVYLRPLVTVIGNADQVGAENYNVELSQKRAEVVAAALNERDINVQALFARGDQAPKVDQVKRVPERLNRRVVMVVREADYN